MDKLMRFFAPYKGRVAINVILLLLQVIGTLYVPTLTAAIVNNGIANADLDYVTRTGVFMLVVCIGVAVVSILETHYSTSTFSMVGRDIRDALFNKAQRLDADDFNRIGPASLITRATNDVQQVQQAYMMLTEMLLPAPLMAIAGLWLAWQRSPELSMTIIVCMAVVLVVVAVVGSRMLPLFRSLQGLLDKITRVLREQLTGIRVIRAFNRTDFEHRRAEKSFEDYANTAIRANKIFAILMPTIFMILNVQSVYMVAVGGLEVANSELAVGDLMALVEYSVLILMYMIMGVMTFTIFPRAQSCAMRVNEVLDIPERDDTDRRPGKLARTIEGAPMLEFRDVTFQYPGADEPVLNNVSFTVRRGETCAIIGGTGSGKSTIARLIPRLYDIQSGTIRVEGINVRDYPRAALRDRVGFVPQKAFLFSGTIAENLRHGREDAADEELEHALSIAQATDFVEEEGGLGAHVSQGGANFSGGQRQRLSIARALVKEADIYVFDDSFSALDFKTDARLRAALRHEVTDAAVVLVAQRVSTIMGADRIVVLDQGRVAGIGTHAELMKTCPTYQDIARSQLKEEELS